jgi:hypothetical protein
MNTAPKHFRPLSDRQRRQILLRIDAAERAAMSPISEGAASAARIVHGLHRCSTSDAPLTADIYLLDAERFKRVDTARMPSGKPAITPGMRAQQQQLHEKNARVDRRLALQVIGVYAVIIAAVIAAGLFYRA